MIFRTISRTLQSQRKRFPVLGLIGPRQVGKTTLVKNLLSLPVRQTLYLDLELPSDQTLLRDPELFFREHMDKTIVLDEIQWQPGLFPVMRSVIDLHRGNGRFVITGSASPALLKQGAETLAGRIVFNELHPFSMTELHELDYRKLWLRGGFPAAYQAKTHKAAFEWLASFVASYVQRDLPALGFGSERMPMSRLIQMIAGSHGSVVNHSTYAKSLGVSVPLIIKYMDLLEDTFLLRKLPAYHPHLKKRVVRSPKLYLRDSGLLHSVWRVGTMTELLGHFLAGYSWEGFVIQQVAAALDPRHQLFFYRTQDGAEVDLIITKGDRPSVALEIKLTNAPTLTKGNYLAFADVGARHNFVVTPSSHDYPWDGAVRVVSIHSLMVRLGDLGLLR